MYAGFPVSLAALASGWGTAFLLSLASGQRPRSRIRDRVTSLAAAAAGFAAVFVPVILLHLERFHGRILSTGGGGLDLEPAAVRAAWAALLGDLFVRGGSWYLPFRDLPVLERTLLPFAATGSLWAWRRYPSWQARGSLLAAPILIALCTISGQYPGMRRALSVLLPYHFCAAAGILVVLRGLPGRARPSLLGGATLVVLSCLHAVAYQFAFREAKTGFNFGTGFAYEPPIPHDFLIGRLREGPVVLEPTEFGGEMDRRYYQSIERLARRYGQLATTEARLHYLDDPGLAPQEGWGILARTERAVGEISRGTGLCIQASRLRSAPGAEGFLSVPLVSASPREEGTICVGSPSHLASIGSHVSLGFAHLEARLRHGLSCAGPYCGPSRPDSVDATGGDLSFVLRDPRSASHLPEGSGSGVELSLGVVQENVHARENRISVNGHPLGTLSAGSVGANGEARFPVPDAAAPSDPLWRITIEAPREAGRIGWGVRWAELRTR